MLPTTPGNRMTKKQPTPDFLVIFTSDLNDVSINAFGKSEFLNEANRPDNFGLRVYFCAKQIAVNCGIRQPQRIVQNEQVEKSLTASLHVHFHVHHFSGRRTLTAQRSDSAEVEESEELTAILVLCSARQALDKSKKRSI